MERVYGLAELIVAKQRHGATGKGLFLPVRASGAASISYRPQR